MEQLYLYAYDENRYPEPLVFDEPEEEDEDEDFYQDARDKMSFTWIDIGGEG